VLDLAGRHGVDVPITQAVEAVCNRGLSPADMIGLLMGRAMKSEMG
jgi:glycerol-3-phosphate dehydrogenase (NAD(P)+)